MTKEEKIELANIIASAVVKTLKENCSEIDKDALIQKCSEIAMNSIKAKGLTEEIHSPNEDFSNNNYYCGTKNISKNNEQYKVLSIYGCNARTLSDDFIRSFSSGELKDYGICKSFLKRDYLKNSISNKLSSCIKDNPAYFTYIELACPVVNPIFICGKTNILSILLDIRPSDIKDVVHYEKYIVTNSQEKFLKKNTVISAKDYFDIEKYNYNIEVATGGEGIQHLLKNFDLHSTLKQMKERYNSKNVVSQKVQKRIDVIEYLIYNEVDINQIMLSVLPVPQVDELMKKLPENIRKNIKNLYSAVALNNDEIRCCSYFGGHVLMQNERKRMLQFSVEKLFNKCLKLYMCEHKLLLENDYGLDKLYDGTEINNKVLHNMFRLIKDYDITVWKNFVAMLFCLDLCSDFSQKSLFNDFLLEYNAFEDQQVWNSLP